MKPKMIYRTEININCWRNNASKKDNRATS